MLSGLRQQLKLGVGEVERRLFPLVALGNQATDQVDQEISHTAVPGMFNLGNVLQLIRQGQRTLLHVLAPGRD